MTGTDSAARARASTAIITALFIFIIYPSPIVFSGDRISFGFPTGKNLALPVVTVAPALMNSQMLKSFF
jgi:hypothetical protein